MARSERIDYVILVSVLLLTVFGIVALASASSDLGKLKFNDTYYYLRHQVLYGLSLGIAGLLAGFFIPYNRYKKWAPILLFITLMALFLTLTPLGFSSGGAKRWLQFGSIVFQPGEILKITFIIYLAAWLSSVRGSIRSHNFFEGFLPFISILGFLEFIFLFQKSTSTAAIVFVSAMATYFVSGAKKRYVFYLGIIIALGFTALVLFTPYRFQRFITFLNPQADAQGAGYQINQALITIGSGGLTGVGYGQSHSKNYLPERIGDSIFAIIAEEFGFIGSVILIAVFFALVARGYLLAKNATDRFGKLMLVGFSTVIGLQAFIHIGSNSGIVPLTGVPLPFISYGGTALAVYLTMAGVMLNISKHA